MVALPGGCTKTTELDVFNGGFHGMSVISQ